MELQVILDFACCTCGGSVSVTLKCAGRGLATGARAVASVNIECPACSNTNQLYFEPTGTVRAVKPYPRLRGVPEPSLN